MGFQLFESSGTFDPAAWGLKAGDTITIFAIGGGGSGGSYHSSSSGNNGSASSFGSIVTAAGGNKGITADLTTAPTNQTGSILGARSGHLASSASTYYYFGGGGGDGWYPGLTQRMAWTPNFGETSSKWGHVGGAPSGSQYAAQTAARGGCGANTSGNPGIGGAGGIGYGAGGGATTGSVSNSTGGNSGCLVSKYYVLPSTVFIAVTVGNGGAGSPSPDRGGGGGARGCVCVFW